MVTICNNACHLSIICKDRTTFPTNDIIKRLALLLSVICGLTLSVRAGVVLSFFEGSGQVYPTRQRTEMVNFWYSQPVDYGMDCSLYSTGQFGVVIFFRGDVVAEAFVSSCDDEQVPKSFTVLVYTGGEHRLLVHFTDRDDFYVIKDNYDSSGKNCVRRFFHKVKNGRLYHGCINGWCSFDVIMDWQASCLP